jgi:hypothetical protein
MDAEDGGQWMTFAELAAARGIDKASASKLVRRRKWRRQTDNRGIVRILVPAEAMDSPSDGPLDSPLDSPSVSPMDIAAIIKPLEAAVAALREQLEHANKQTERAENRAEEAVIRADRAEQAVADERNRADRAESGRNAERSRADELRDRIEALQVQLATAEADGSALTIETAELTARLNQVRRQAQETQEAAEAIRQADEAARKAGGRLARAWRAWRGG